MYGQIAGTETVTGNVYRWGLPAGARAAQISDARVGRIGLVVTDVPRSLVGKRKLALVFPDAVQAQKVLDNRWSLLRLTIAPGPTEAVTGKYAASPTRETWRVLSAVNAATGAPLNLRPNSQWGALVRTGVTTYEPGKVAPRPTPTRRPPTLKQPILPDIMYPPPMPDELKTKPGDGLIYDMGPDRITRPAITPTTVTKVPLPSPVTAQEDAPTGARVPWGLIAAAGAAALFLARR